jgi:hypothetical protein
VADASTRRWRRRQRPVGFDSCSAAVIAKVRRIPWSDEFWRPIKLNDGRALATLGDARDLIANLPPMKRAEGYWQAAGELLTRASIAPSAKYEVQAAVVRALKAEGLI